MSLDLIPPINPFDGLSIFSQSFKDILNATGEAAQRYTEIEDMIRKKLATAESPVGTGGGDKNPYFLAKIDGVPVETFPGSKRWEYDWHEVVLSAGGLGFATKTNGRTSAEDGMAINLAEASHNFSTTLINYGQDIADDANRTITIGPIAQFSIVDTMRIVKTSDGSESRAVFTASPNPITVTCL